ncbi:MAG TPA: NAD(P)-dependent alcohol dehydrogenase [Candidatus Binataceae bacterium]|jgi:NADPH:quinone reductase-like Zn-dependent oxidoreductase|nr:NAD(P)-dependent alcohol dehydrogenase [Candidatus Binataceae bacterium]
MKAYELRNESGSTTLAMVERARPVPAPGEVLVRIRATSLNYRDLLIGKAPRSAPLVPLCDGAGEVVEVGVGVSGVKVGDRVAGTYFQDWVSGPVTKNIFRTVLGQTIDGVLAEYVVLKEHGVVRIPEHLSFEEEATLPCAGLTAWQALVTEGRIKAGDTVVVMGTGGVSIFALQFALLCGAKVIATTGSDSKMERLKSMGASAVINYKTTPEWDKQVLELTGGAGADHVVEVGGAGTLPRSLRAVRHGGFISLIGVLGGAGEKFSPGNIILKGVRLQGIFVGSKEMFEDMNRAIALNRMRPVVDRTYQFEEAAQALAFVESGQHFGKVCIRV